MSVQINTYVVFGIAVEYDAVKEHFDALEPYMDSAFDEPRPFSDVTCIYDGMNGEYAVFGFVLRRTANDGHFGGIVEMPEVSPDMVRFMERELARAVPDGVKYQRMRWLVVGHYR